MIESLISLGCRTRQNLLIFWMWVVREKVGQGWLSIFTKYWERLTKIWEYGRNHDEEEYQELNFECWLVWLSGLSPCHEPKGCWFDSLSGHMPGLRVRSPAGGMQEAANWCFSHTLMFLFLFLLPFPLKYK